MQLLRLNLPNRRWALAIVLLGGVLIPAHILAGRQGLDLKGGLLILDHLFDLVTALTLVTVGTAVGRLALRRAGVDSDRPLEALLFGATVGLGIIATAILFLAAVGLARPAPVILLVAAFGGLARRDLRELTSLAAQSLSDLRRGTRYRGLQIVAMLVLVAVAMFLFTLALAPPVDWDALMYHLQVPVQILQEGRIHLPEDNLHVSRIGLEHMLYLPLLAVGSAAGPAVLNALAALLLALGVLSFCTRFLGKDTASLSVALFWGTTTILLVAITPRVDVTLSLYLFLAQYALIIALSSQSQRHYFLAAVLLGFAVGIKFLALPYAAALAPLIVWVAVSRDRPLRRWLWSVAVFAVIAAIIQLPWLIKNWLLLHAPLYPLFAAPRLQPWLIPLFGSQMVPPWVGSEIFSWIWELRQPFNVWSAFFAPKLLTIEGEGAHYYANPALLLLPLWLFFVRKRTLNWLAMPALGYLLLLLLTFPMTNLRYLIPAAAPLTIVVAYALVTLSRRLPTNRAAHGMLALVLLLALLPSGRAAYVWLSRTAAIGHLAGIRSADEYRSSHFDPAVRNYARLIRTVNRGLNHDDRILMLLEARGYYFEPNVIQDNRGTNWPLLAASHRTENCLAGTGITHVLVGVGALRYYMLGGLDPSVLRWDEFEQFARRCLTQIYADQSFELFAVK